ncbi:nucleotidyltransferase domain-containing protein [Sedimentibacter hydroxybenzoicus DSM 7310]|uniref:Nucleotidyltransferase domain-containing protein n=1 Tax=Sedimentibacter hydroxybenzoicus DSM 7310 TaxID=1123245 RepID=A0A974BLP9_SEDHY|nr:nucleotidyltransferase domain-containing protein [Sedimentibacter hydroxybenzoicus]NYB74915.1 nucleotidyltransferase domain-containing protein [Sedimentibacter hydroxybenzoicus DSM 7310]
MINSILINYKLINELKIHENLKEDILKCVQIIVAERIPIKKIGLFGSCSRGEANATSDIDLVVITNHQTTRVERGLIFDAVNCIDLNTKCDIVFYTDEQLISSSRWFEKSIKENVIWIGGI